MKKNTQQSRRKSRARGEHLKLSREELVSTHHPSPTTHHSGFTLLEIIISVGIFSVIVVAAIGITLSIKVAQEKTANIQDIEDNIRYALEFMTKEMRQGSLYELSPVGCAIGSTPCTKIKFGRTSSSGGQQFVWYCLLNTTIYRYIATVPSFFDLCDASNGLALTSDNIEVTGLNFYALGNLPGPADGQPRVTVAITASSKDARTQLQSAFHLQTTVTQRQRDGKFTFIMDNGDPGTGASAGSWNSTTLPSGFVGADYLVYSGALAIVYYAWTPSSLPPGNYDIAANFIPAANRSTSVVYAIRLANSTVVSVTVDQHNSSGAWYGLGGPYALGAGSYVLVHSASNGVLNNSVSADAVRFTAH